MQDALQKNGPHDVKFEMRYDLKELKEIASASGSPALKKETGYLDRARFHGKENFICKVLEGGGRILRRNLWKKSFSPHRNCGKERETTGGIWNCDDERNHKRLQTQRETKDNAENKPKRNRNTLL